MQSNDRKKLALILEPKYKALMIELYKEFRDYDSVHVRLEVVRWIDQHNHNRLMEMFGKRKYRRQTERKLKSELQTLKLKNELEDFLRI